MDSSLKADLTNSEPNVFLKSFTFIKNVVINFKKGLKQK